MEFDIKGKVALVTGGASGIGLSCVKQLLRDGAKGVAIADINTEQGETIVKELEDEFGRNKSLFVKTDVSDKRQYEEAFKKTVEKYNAIDILVNNAGIYNEKNWEKMTAINFNGIINGMVLAMHDYLPKYKQGATAVVANISSISGVTAVPGIPIYTAIKAGIVGMTRSWGAKELFEKSNVRVVVVCPGLTESSIGRNTDGPLNEFYYQFLMPKEDEPEEIPQTSDDCARAVVQVLKKADSGTIWISEGGLPAYEFVMPPWKNFRPNSQ